MDIVKKLMEAKEAYYNGEPIMSDDEFDTLEDELRKKDPDNDYFSIVGITNSKAKVKHVISMLSAGKGKVLSDIMAWLKKINALMFSILVEPKVDGMSANIVYDKGKLILIATRGDGLIGQDVTHVSKYMKIPQTIDLKTRVEVRGEFHLSKKYPNPENKPLRNMVVGMVNRKDSGLEELKHIHFAAYQVFGTDIKTEYEKLNWLELHGFEAVWRELVNVYQLQEIYDKYMNTLRAEWDYETDGIMLIINDNTKWEAIDANYTVEHHHHYNIAWKGVAERKESVLLNIEWNVSRQGKLIPVAIIEPVVLGQRTVSRAALTSYENVMRMKFEKGDKVLIEFANDVIPYLAANITKNISQR